MERSGVGEDRHVDVRGDIRRQAHAEGGDEVEHHLAAGRGARIEPVDGPVRHVVGVVIDVDDGAAVEAFDAGPRQVAAFHDDRGIEQAVDVLRDDDVVDAGKLLQRRRRRIGVDDEHLLAELAQRVGHGHLRPYGVAVRPSVRRNDEALARADHLDDLLNFRAGCRHR